jgi:hypothetical protein
MTLVSFGKECFYEEINDLARIVFGNSRDGTQFLNFSFIGDTILPLTQGKEGKEEKRKPKNGRKTGIGEERRMNRN